MSVSRREFLGAAAVAAAATAAPNTTNSKGMPTRILGKTGARVSILAFGSGSRFLMYKEEDEALAALNHALDLGISYVDTAYAYGDGLSEERVGKVMKTRRKEVWLATKVPDRNGDEAMRRIEGSLKRLRTDHLDLIHIHSLGGDDDLAAIEAKDGVLMRLYQLRDEKVTRAVGITSHTDPTVLRTALMRHDFDCTQMALNAARQGMAKPEHPTGSFETLALPVARYKDLGVIAMKIFAQEKLSGKAEPDQLIRYSLSLPGVTATVIGMPKVEYIERNVEIAKAYQPMPADDMKQLSNQLADAYKVSIDHHFSDDLDC
ncbi:MAG TPA: aldo/keto reductase [Bryobacteraceae bacterium]|nr:aldo/keto reductase [Bryobacteraceae bacterium]